MTRLGSCVGAALLLFSCTSSPPAGDEVGETSTQTSESGACPDGSAGCPCYGNSTCDADLVCSPAGICQPEDCPEGTQGCPCYGNASCNAGLECSDANVCEPTSSESSTTDTDTSTDTTSTTDTTTETSDSETTGGDPCAELPLGMVCVPAGTFEMGTDFAMVYAQQTDPTEKPAHMVTISNTFWMDETEVTAGAYADCVDAGECTVPMPAQNEYPTYQVGGKQNHPINGVSWYQAVQYCSWLGKRLPTEAEWEYAARGTDGRLFPWGDELTTCSHVVADGCGLPGPGPVGSKPVGASPFGALDMAGNVYEYCADFYDPGYYNISPEVDPQGPDVGTNRSMRGTAYAATIGQPESYRSTLRNLAAPTEGTQVTGFRCAQDPI